MAAAMTFPLREIRRIQFHALRWPAVVLVATIAVGIYLRNKDCFAVGGAIITGIGS